MTERTIGIMTALEAERRAVCDVFEASEVPEILGGTSYRIAHAQTRSGERLRIVIGSSGRSGTTEVVLPTDRMIRHCRPECLLLVGIACGLPDRPLCSVLTSEQVYAYDYVKTTPEVTLDRPRAKVVPTEMLAMVGRMGEAELVLWRQLFQGWKPGAPEPSVDPSIWIASGNTVMGNGMLTSLHAKYDKLRAGEMEAYGFAEACDRNLKPWLVIRGVSDHGDASKNDAMHQPASHSAAAFARVLLEHCYEGDSKVVPTTPLRRYIVSEVERRSAGAVEELLSRKLIDPGVPDAFVHEVSVAFRNKPRRFIALCGRKRWGYDLTWRYYEACLDWATVRAKHRNVKMPEDSLLNMSHMTRLFIKPPMGFSLWDRHVLAAHHRTKGATALVVEQDQFRELLSPVAGDILNDGLGVVAIDRGPKPLLGTDWLMLAHAGSDDQFRFAEFREEYAVRELISMFRKLIPRTVRYTPADGDGALPWPPPKEVYEQRSEQHP